MSKIYRELCVLLSAKFGKIVAFRFNNFVQVANNALEHYKSFGNLFLYAFTQYGQIEDLNKKESFIKKLNTLDRNQEPSKEYHSLLSTLFPELF
ncbi:DUF6035 family protein [Pedobacter xixiisoli]|uniref:DUF7829 domain-containing protein n=1 Tax=Pedobacter xixiisoli TaxID=1476464 RepID=A0A285ZW50_9SPHI|nr:DUF6035 family protein [Pedobacter xixiisoli]SOD13856.1 hypothetical protein SAMN06297358_1277 [Pedobacter xixiisoli]